MDQGRHFPLINVSESDKNFVCLAGLKLKSILNQLQNEGFIEIDDDNISIVH